MSGAVVVVGAGMVGHRFAEELVRADREERYDVHLVGAEEYEPYNRILLTEVVAGRASLRSLSLPRLPDRVRVRRGVSATRLDRDAREVELSDGTRLGYERVVLATGARALVPPIAGLEERPRHVHTLRDLDDTRAVVARAANAHHAVVLGGGLLGLEAACGLASRGVAVTVVQDQPQLMAGQLDAAPAHALAASLERLGVRVRLGATVAEAVRAYGELVAVRLTDGTLMAADLLLVSCGVRPETMLAESAGLPVDRGIRVGSDLASPADPRVHALGDCAQPPEGGSGLLAPGWEQAARLARRLVSREARVPDTAGGARAPEPAGGARAPEPAGGEPATALRLKAVGVDLVALGVRPSAARAGDRVLTVDDPAAGRHVALVVRQERLVGATCLGAPAVAADLSVALTQGTPVPADPLALLAGDARPEEPTPVRMPATTTVCRCNDVSKQELVDAWEAGAGTVDEVVAVTRATTGCGGCTAVVCGVVDWLRAADPAPRGQLLNPLVTPVRHEDTPGPRE